MPYYCSKKFRVNANQSRVDIWLIYKCTKCDKTLKLSIYKGIRPHDLPSGLFDKFIVNDEVLAWKYAFDRNFLRQHDCVIDYTNVGYIIDGAGAYDCCKPLALLVSNPLCFDLKLCALLAMGLGLSVSKIKKLVKMGIISTSPEVDIVKHKIVDDINVFIIPEKDVK